MLIISKWFTKLNNLGQFCFSCAGFIVNFISQPVLSGFTTVAAITICSTQVKSLLGIQFPADGVVSVAEGVYEHMNEIHQNDMLLSIFCIVVLLTLRVRWDILKEIAHEIPL